MFGLYEGQSKITEPYPITFELSKMDIYLDDISLKLYVIYLITLFISVGRLFVTVARQHNMPCQSVAMEKVKLKQGLIYCRLIP